MRPLRLCSLIIDSVVYSIVVCALLSAIVVPEAEAQGRRKSRPKHQIKIATLAPDGSTWMNIMYEMDDAIRAATDNRVGIKFYPSGVQGDELMVLRKIRSGQLHGGGFTGQGIGALAPELRVLEIPFLFENYEQVDAVRAEINPKLERILDDKGYALLGWADVVGAVTSSACWRVLVSASQCVPMQAASERPGGRAVTHAALYCRHILGVRGRSRVSWAATYERSKQSHSWKLCER